VIDLKPTDLSAQDWHMVRGCEACHHGEPHEADLTGCRSQGVAQPRRLIGVFGEAQGGEQLLGLIKEEVEKLLELRTFLPPHDDGGCQCAGL
jgi:hypothetical protein